MFYFAILGFTRVLPQPRPPAAPSAQIKPPDHARNLQKQKFDYKTKIFPNYLPEPLNFPIKVLLGKPEILPVVKSFVFVITIPK
jgi:hypothetical protein